MADTRPRPSRRPDYDFHDGGESQCYCCGKYGHTKNDCSMSDKACDLCGKIGHLKSMCHSASSDGGKGYGKASSKNGAKGYGKHEDWGHGGGKGKDDYRGGKAYGKDDYRGSKGHGKDDYRGGKSHGKDDYGGGKGYGTDDYDTCLCCGKQGHSKADCHLRDVGCKICGMMGHVKATCRQAEASDALAMWTPSASKGKGGKKGHDHDDRGGYGKSDNRFSPYGETKYGGGKGYGKDKDKGGGAGFVEFEDRVCNCCGKAGHVKAECPMKEKVCDLCGKVGHLKAACHSVMEGPRPPQHEPRSYGSQHHEKGGGKGKDGGQGKGGHWVWQADPPAAPEFESCLCCGKSGHVKADCRMRDVGCSTCGKTGHIKATCRQSLSEMVCKCCGQAGHVKAECRHRDEECNVCGRIGHLRKMCRNTTADSTDKKSSSFGGVIKSHVKTKKGEGKGQAGTCKCCGITGHVKADCRHKDDECNMCGKVGHLRKVCFQSKDVECLCCGEPGHAKMDCELKDAGCGLCGKTGHIDATCRHADAPPEARGGVNKKTLKTNLKIKTGDRESKTGAAKKKCFNCKEVGHSAIDCPQPKLCAICRSAEHERKECPNKETACDTCGKKGHLTEYCTRKDASAQEQLED